MKLCWFLNTLYIILYSFFTFLENAYSLLNNLSSLFEWDSTLVYPRKQKKIYSYINKNFFFKVRSNSWNGQSLVQFEY